METFELNYVETAAEWSSALVSGIGARIAERRASRGLSLQKLSARCTKIGYPIARNSIWKIENGAKASISIQEIFIISIALDCTPSSLVIGTEVDEAIPLAPGVDCNPIDAHSWFGAVGLLTGDILPYSAGEVTRSEGVQYDQHISRVYGHTLNSWMRVQGEYHLIVDEQPSADIVLSDYERNLIHSPSEAAAFEAGLSALLAAFNFFITVSGLLEVEKHSLIEPIEFREILGFIYKCIGLSKRPGSKVTFPPDVEEGVAKYWGAVFA